MNRTTCALVAAALSSLVALGACDSLSKDSSATKPTPSNSTMSMGEDHAPIPANTAPMSASQIQETGRKAAFLVYGQQPDSSYAWGTAFIHDLDEEVAITNAHVVDGIPEPRAMFFDGTEHPVEVIASDPCTDLAVIHVNGALPKGSVRLPLGDSDALAPGDAVTAIGYNVSGRADFQGAQAVPAPGVVQDLRVSVNTDPALPEYVGTIQYSATLPPGNSGGPLLDSKGNVVGINALSSTASAQGRYYSIPIKSAHEETDKLMTGESRNDLGWALTPHLTKRPSADVETALRRAGYDGGMFVESIHPGGPVDGQVQAGDLVTKLNNKSVNTQQDVCDIVESMAPGGMVTADGVHVFSQPALGQFHSEWRMPGTS